MKSVLNVKVSRFNNYLSPNNPIEINLLSWLNSDAYKYEVEKIRAEPDEEKQKELKGLLPAITPSGTFYRREEKFLLCPTFLMQFDIDWKENKHIGNFQDLKAQICNIPNVAYCAQSVRGNGFWGLIPIATPEKHKQHFEALELVFEKLGIIIDEKPKNIASLRGYSYDATPYFNHNAKTFKSCMKLPEPRKLIYSNNPTSDQKKAETCLEEIHNRKIDLTGSYKAWFDIGCSLAGAFGESGLDYFHQVSQYHPNYSARKTDRQYAACLKGGYKFTIGTFLKYCEEAGIKYKEVFRMSA